jgi:hypothetical protein
MTNNNTSEVLTMNLSDKELTNHAIIRIARKNGVDKNILHAMVWADQLILDGDHVICLHDSPHECDTQFFIGKKDK